MTDRKQSSFRRISSIANGKFLAPFGDRTNERISKEDLFKQIKDETQVFIYPTIEQLQSANLEADPDFPIYVRVEETQYHLYKITSLAAGVNDISLDNGTTATRQEEYSETGFVIGPSSSINNAIALFDGVMGTQLKNGPVLSAIGSALIQSPDVTDTSYVRINIDGTVSLRNTSQHKSDILLNNVDNTSDAQKVAAGPIFDALSLKAPLASPVFTGNPTAPTPAANDNDTSIATTAYVQTELLDRVQTIENAAALSTFTPVAGQVYYLKEYIAGTGLGGGKVVGKGGSITPNNVTTFACAVNYVERIEYDEIDIFMAGGLRGTDIREALQRAVDAAPSTYDITSAYTYEPSWKIRIPYGNYFLSERVLVAKNNIIIEGDGMFNTYIKSTSNTAGNPIQSEMIRFRGAYACGIKNLTLDGGLPFNVLSTPNFGCRIPLVLDQVAHFDMDGFNSCNYRTRGIQCIHVWESKFGEIRCFNGWGLDDALGIVPGGLVFDGFSKEENFFPGSESNQIYIAKYAFSGVGSIVRFDSPCFNIVIGQGVFEGRTYNDYQPNNMNVSKIYISGISANCGIQHAWVYFHDQPFNSPAVFIEAANAGPGCYFDNINIYQENAAPGVQHMELQQLLNSSSAFPVRVNLNIHDHNNSTGLFQGVFAGSLFQGDIFYRNNASRTLANFVGTTGATNFNGQVTMSTGDFGSSVPQVYNFKSVGTDVSAIDGSGIYSELKCRAAANFDGGPSGGPRMQKGLLVTRNSTGQYTATFTPEQMPDANYSVNHSIVRASLGDTFEVVSQLATHFTFAIRDNAGVFHDSPLIGLSVFR